MSEKSVLVKDVKPADLFELGKQFGQDSVIYKGKDGVIGMYHTKGAPKVTLAVDKESGKGKSQFGAGKDLYSKSRGTSFEFEFDWDNQMAWDGKSTVTRKDALGHYGKGKGDKGEKSKDSDTAFEEAIKGKKFRHPETGNDVLYNSLPAEEQKRVRAKWKSSESGAGAGAGAGA